MPKFSKRSLNELKSVHPDLVGVMHEAIKDTPVDFVVICGHRGEQAQNAAFSTGHSKLKFPKSRHNSLPSEAVDIVPFVKGKISWDADYFKPLSLHVLTTAKRLGVDVRWGADWNGNGSSDDERFIDMPHFELKRKTK